MAEKNGKGPVEMSYLTALLIVDRYDDCPVELLSQEEFFILLSARAKIMDTEKKAANMVKNTVIFGLVFALSVGAYQVMKYFARPDKNPHEEKPAAEKVEDPALTTSQILPEQLINPDNQPANPREVISNEPVRFGVISQQPSAVSKTSGPLTPTNIQNKISFFNRKGKGKCI